MYTLNFETNTTIEHYKNEQEELDKMFDFIKNQMSIDKWYKVSAKATELVNILYSCDIVNEIEFSEDKQKIRKVDLDFSKKLELKWKKI